MNSFEEKDSEKLYSMLSSDSFSDIIIEDS